MSTAPTARVAKGPPVTVTNGSVTEMLVKIALPVLVTVKLYVIVSPTETPAGNELSAYVPCFSNLMEGTYTGIIIVAGSQLVGFNFSQIVYTIVYVPAGVPAGTDTTPVVVFRVGTGAPPIEVATVVTAIFTLVTVAWAPLRVSIPLPLSSKTLPIFALPIIPLEEARVSSCATIAALVTGTNTVADEQFVGFNFSQIW